jgi:hypothetical protein
MIEHAEAIFAALSNRFAEVLPPDTFEIRVNPGAFSVGALGPMAGNSCGAFPLPLLFPIPASLRLHLLCTATAELVQEFATRILGQPWPAPLAPPHVHVSRNAINIWYGSASLDQADLALRPIARSEIGV